MKTSLCRDEWIQAGWELLLEGGVKNVTLAPLCRRLGVTKGSFYWHFKDRDDLLQALLDEWEDRSTRRFIAMLEAHVGPPEEAFEKMIKAVVATRNIEVDQVFRDWARSDSRASALVTRIDERRLEFLRRVMRAIGFDEQEAQTRVVLMYYYSVGIAYAEAIHEDPEERMGQVLRIMELLLKR